MNRKSLEDINRLMAKESSKAMAVLMMVLRNPETTEANRIKAATSILDYSYKFMALAEQQEIIDQLEAQINAIENDLEI